MSMHTGIAFSEANRLRVQHNYEDWWAGELDRPLVSIVLRAPPKNGRAAPPAFAAHLPQTLSVPEVIDLYSEHLKTQRWYGDAFPSWLPNFGPGVVAAFLGLAKLDMDERTVWFEPREKKELEELELSFDPANVWWNRVRDLTEEAALRWKGEVTVGYTDLGGNLDILASLRTSKDLLLDTMDKPELVARRASELTQLWLRYYRELKKAASKAECGYCSWAPIWAPGSMYMLQSDFAYMISPDMFEQFVLPDLHACCEEIEYPFYHLDGKGQLAHLDHLCSIKKLRGIQWVPGAGAEPPECWPEVLHKIRAAGKLCQVYTSPAGARRIIREHNGGKGFLFSIRDMSGEVNVHPDDAKHLMELLRKESELVQRNG